MGATFRRTITAWAVPSIGNSSTFSNFSPSFRIAFFASSNSSRAAVLRGIESVRKNAPSAPLLDLTDPEQGAVPNPKFELYRDKAEQYRFRLRSRNGKIIAVSDGYGTKAAALSGLDSVRKNAGEAALEE